MIESAEAMVNLREIAKAGSGHLDALLFAAEDCESSMISRIWVKLNGRLRRCGDHQDSG